MAKKKRSSSAAPGDLRDWRSIADDREKYKAYLCSREWAVKREAVRERSGGKCERCELLPMDACHHLTYERKYNEDLEDLQAICDPCHEFTHGKSEFDPKQNIKFIKFLALFPESREWLSGGFVLRWVDEAWEYSPLVPVICLWTSKCMLNLGKMHVLDRCKNYKNDEGEHLDGVCLSDFETDIYTQSGGLFSGTQLAFLAWLNYGTPSESPVGSKVVYEACLKTADSMSSGV